MGRRHRLTLAITLAIILAAASLLALSQNTATAEDDAEYRRMRLFTEVLEQIERKYVEKKTKSELITEAVKGMVSSLDPHSSYLTPEEYKDLQIDTKGSFSGVGIEITMRENVLTVVSPIEGTPAYKAGVKAGDRVIKIDGKLTKGMSMMDAVKAIRGPKGSTVVLTVLRQGEPKLRDIPIKRDTIPLRSVRYNMLEDGYGYVRLSTFRENTTEDLKNALRVLQSQSVPLRGLVLDLRNDPGGLLQEAVATADQFLSQGTIVYTKGRNGRAGMTFAASPGATAGNYPIVVLVNQGSASASEIVAGALQDHKRGFVLGTTTFGKASVQTIIPMSDGGALRLTTARYYTPNGRAIQAKGIVPDLVVPFEPPEKKPQAKSQAVREKDLVGHIPEEKGKAGDQNKNHGDDKLFMDQKRLRDDNQLTRALELLKAWQVFSRSMDPAVAGGGRK